MCDLTGPGRVAFFLSSAPKRTLRTKGKGVMRESNSRPPAPEAGIIPLDQSPDSASRAWTWRSDQKGKGRAGVEPATYRAATNCSTTELTPQRCREGTNVSSHLRAPTGSVYLTQKKLWRSRVSIPVPPACKAGALPFELHPQGRL